MKRYSEEQHEFLRAFIPGHSTLDVVEEFNERYPDTFVTYNIIKSYKNNHKIKGGTNNRHYYGSKVFPREVVKFIEHNHKGKSQKQMQTLLNQTFGTHYKLSQIHAYYTNHKIHNGIDCRFKKGCVPWSKGKHIEGSPASKSTQFKKGCKPHNTQPIGTRVKKQDGYWWEKISDNKWEICAKLIWEKEHGPLPDGYILTFLDGNKDNLDPANIRAISKATNAYLNVHVKRPENKELAETAILVAELKLAAINRKKNRKG